MAYSIPTSSTLTESIVVKASLTDVWHLIKLGSFSNWWSVLKSSSAVKDTNEETDVYRFEYKDGTVQDVKQEEHSTIDHFITYSVISSSPALTYSSSLSTIRCFPITAGDDAGHTFVQWTGAFSSDADAGVLGDAKYKRAEGLRDLAAAAAAGRK